MKQLLKALRYVPKRYGIVAAVIAAVSVPAVLFAWGPSRATFTIASPAPYVTFNSITDNPNVGDERNFVVIKDAANTQSGGWQDKITAEPGKEYLVRVYFHNNAAENLNLVATNTRAMVSLPTTTGKEVPISGFISADNANPKQVWDDVSLTSDKDFNLAYVPGSATFRNNVMTGGTALSDSLFTSTGVLLGYDKLDGKVPGCFKYAGTVTFKVKPQFAAPAANFDMAKTVRKTGDTSWVETAATKPGDTVQYRIKYSNTSQTQQDNVTVKDTMPTGVSYVPGTTQVFTVTKPAGYTATDEVTTKGINIGSFAAGSTAYVMFSAKVAANDQLTTCGPNTLKNVASVSTGGTSKEDTANVTVTKECLPPPPTSESYVCTALTKIQKSRDTYEFAVKATYSSNVTAKEVRVDFGDNQSTIVDYGATIPHTYAAPGTYTAVAYVTFDVNGKTVTGITSDTCKQSVEVTPPPTTPETPTTPTTPETPAEMPSTGPEALLGGLFGSSALGLGAHSWLSSRRAYRAAARR